MPDIENALPNDNSSARPKRMLSKTEKLQDILLVVSIAQLITAFLLYLLETTVIPVLLAESLAVIGLTLLAHFRYENRAVRILLCVIDIFLIAVPFLFSVIFILLYYTEAVPYPDTDTMIQFQADFWMTFAVIAMPPFLFMQPVFVVNATARRRFDMVLLRIVTLLTLLFSILLCAFALAYKPDGNQLILTSQTYSWNIFGSAINFTVAIDSIFTRILFCTCSAVLTVLSFRIRSNKKDKTK